MLISAELVNCNLLKNGLQNSIAFINKPRPRNLENKHRNHVLFKAQNKSSEENKSKAEES